MTQKYRNSLQTRRLPALAPEQLLLLSIFGSDEIHELVESELDRRSSLRPKQLQAVPHNRPLRAAA